MSKLRRLLFVVVMAASLLAVALLGRFVQGRLPNIGWWVYLTAVLLAGAQSAAVLLAWSCICSIWPSAAKWRASQEQRLAGGVWMRLGKRHSWLLVSAVTFLLGPAPATIAALAVNISRKKSFIIVTVASAVTYIIQLPILLGWSPW